MDPRITEKTPINHHIFRMYDIRGIAWQEITPEIAYLTGRAFGTFIKRNSRKETSIVVGRDNRLSSPELSAEICQGLIEAGCHVIDIGLVPSPVLNFAVIFLNAQGGINVTASHNPPDQNGFKLLAENAYPVAEDDIQHLLRMIQKEDFENGKGYITSRDIKEDYLAKVTGLVEIERPLKVVIDAGNGTTGSIAPQLLRLTGCEVVELYCEPDGTFPNHMPNPENPANMVDLQVKVLSHNADIGLAYDGDGDRLGVVNEKGERYNADQVLMLLGRDFLSRYPESKIVLDVKSSQTVIDNIISHGGIPVLWKTGHSLIKRKMHHDNIMLGGEFSGHLFAAENYYPIDDAMVASCRILEFLSRSGQSLSRLYGDMPELHSTGVIELPCPDERKSDVVTGIIGQLSSDYEIIDIDGARVQFDGGWALVRASNTSANLTVRFEAVSEEKLKKIQTVIFSGLRQYPEVTVPVLPV